MIQERIHKLILDNCDTVFDWFRTKSEGLSFPIYSSFDVRDSGGKIGPVDANLFPAGFNNICAVDKENAPEIFKNYLQARGVQPDQLIGLVTEQHTGNSYYWENVAAIRNILRAAGYRVHICIPSEMTEPKTLTTPSGEEVLVYGAKISGGDISIANERPDLLVCNNDFSDNHLNWTDNFSVPINPSPKMGWYQRKKNHFFNHYNELVGEFANVIKIDPRYLRIETELFANFDVNDSDSLSELSQKVNLFIEKRKVDYQQMGLDIEPYCFIKNNAGTYGLGVTQVQSGNEVLDWNSKMRKKMKAAKGGREVTEVIIQEGIPTHFKDDGGASAEPAIYMVGDELVGGFLRTHSNKNEKESLNSPGAVFKRLCMSDLMIDQPGCPMENVYGWVSKLSVLSLANEAKSVGIRF